MPLYFGARLIRARLRLLEISLPREYFLKNWEKGKKKKKPNTPPWLLATMGQILNVDRFGHILRYAHHHQPQWSSSSLP
jgi:hypothetical protein